MSSQDSQILLCQWVDGFPIPGGFKAENFRSAKSYKPRPNDVFVATYPKCGTTWTQYILVYIFRQGEPLDSPDDVYLYSPFLDVKGAKSAEEMLRPGAIKTHMPFDLVPWSPDVKYIYVARNPKDCCVSYYHHTKRIPDCFDGTFDDYFELFIEGRVEYGDYFSHLLCWYAHRNDPNVLFITYEELKEDFDSTVLKMASFIDDQKYAEPMRRNPDILKNIKKHSSFQFIKDSELKQEQIDKNSPKKEGPSKPKMHWSNLRKGIIGDWKNYFSDEQGNRLRKKFNEELKGTDLLKFWQKYM